MDVVLCMLVGLVAGGGVGRVAGRLAGRAPAGGVCELLCAAGAAAAATAPTWQLALASAALMWWCVCASAVDLLVRRLPNVLTVGGAAVIVAAATTAGRAGPALVGAVLLAGPLLAAHLASPRSLGAGDVKLGLGLGAVAALGGAQVWTIAALVPPLLTGIAGFTLLVRQRMRHGPRVSGLVVPHGPSMCAATVLALFVVG
ncbi:prepilin peptidase [Rhodococcus chondri]|uniref:Prepilin peptidase n=1 Tax=Rhodococcus chondri TaxID=3065941 RepID=A0ABU7JXH4_9NOCA|nr:prepilin peptidase [Rhodococcus sp. CC-R104]MEE2034721.1 prepilin peptidase [Rhodococcus sp. CC-R104]